MKKKFYKFIYAIFKNCFQIHYTYIFFLISSRRPDTYPLHVSMLNFDAAHRLRNNELIVHQTD